MAEAPQWQNNPAEAKVGVIMGSDSDLDVMKKASTALTRLEVNHEIRFISAHRTSDMVKEYAEEAEERGIDVIVAGAGGAAHLPGMTAAETVIPVIGVPIENANHALKNAALFSIIDMPEGVPVLTVAPNAALNAGIAAAQILARNDAALLIRLKDAKQTIYKDVVAKDALLQKLGADAYLAEMQQNSFSNIPIGVIF